MKDRLLKTGMFFKGKPIWIERGDHPTLDAYNVEVFERVMKDNMHWIRGDGICPPPSMCPTCGRS